MANTYTALYYHLVFSTKNRVSWIDARIESRVWAYIGGIARDNDMIALRVGGMPDHLHILTTVPKTLALAKTLQLLKGGSSKWMHETFPQLRNFAWQDGYAAFSVGRSEVDSVIAYIENQREHHRKKTFQEEYREFLIRNAIEFDEQFAWG